MAIPGLENINLNLGVNYSGFASTGLTIGYIFFMLLIFALVFWFIMKRISFNYKVYIIAKRGGKNISIGEDRGRIVTKDGVTKLLFGSWARRNVRLPAPPPEMIYNGARGKPCLFLYKYGDKDYTPILIKEKKRLFTKTYQEPTDYNYINATEVVDLGDQIKLEPIPSYLDMWNIQLKKQQINKLTKPNFMEKYGAQIIMIFAIIAVVIIIWMTLGKIDDVAQALNNAASTAKGGQQVGGMFS